MTYWVTSIGRPSLAEVPTRVISTTGIVTGIWSRPASVLVGMRHRWCSRQEMGPCPAISSRYIQSPGPGAWPATSGTSAAAGGGGLAGGLGALGGAAGMDPAVVRLEGRLGGRAGDAVPVHDLGALRDAE